MIAAAYVRVSSEAQTHDTQRDAIERLATARSEQIGAWYAERLSGKTLDRPELHRLRADARAGKLAKLYVYRIDRLTRSGISDTLSVLDELKRHGVRVVSVADGFDVDGAAAEVVLAVMAWAAKMERAAINERLGAARRRLESQGRTWGRPSRLTAAQVAEIADRRKAGESVRAISIAMKIPRATVGRAVSKVTPK